MRFHYTATREGEEVEGTEEAIDRFDLARVLKSRGLIVISAREAGKARGDFFKRLNERFSTVSTKNRIFFIKNLSEMLSAGLTLTRSLGVFAKQASSPRMAKMARDIIEKVDKGSSLAASLSDFPKIFGRSTVAMVEAGEKSGKLPETLEIVGGQLEKAYKLKKRIRGAMIYPGIIITAMALVGILMLVYIVPTLADTFAELGADLPLSTRVIIGFSDFIVAHYLIAFLIVVFGALGVYELSRLEPVKRAWAWSILHMPIIKHISKKANSAAMARTLSSLLASGVEIVDALSITRKVVPNVYFQEVIDEAVLAVPGGDSLSSVFQKPSVEKLYPPFVGEMVAVGEETGKMPEMLERLAVFYENEVDAVVKDLSTVIEPAIMIFVGIGVGFFALSMIQPIYEVGNAI